ncbi:hypothetical protein BCR35DRAFT_349195 [Leucosporidium creatinivorum]|uniref:CUE domain-containing protein n=1 Tax=Leucosporidium creatinivorum TaxID=106004 RepID=A0A1Y2G4L7_9BASI|nr:hypothetical protein BCR35DRAFT_349195 [Leucosporidium creatinivorum]
MELISLLLSCPTEALPSLLASCSVSSSLAHLLATSTPSSTERKELQQLITRLSFTPTTLSLPLLALYAQSYLPTNHALVTWTIQQALSLDSALAATVHQQLPTLLQQSLTHLSESHPPPSYSHLVTLLTPLLALIRSLASLSCSLLPLLPQLAQFYSSYLPSLLPSHHTTPHTNYLSLKLSLLESIHHLLLHSFLLPLQQQSLTPQQRATTFSSLHSALQPLLASSPAFPSSSAGVGAKALISAPLIADLQHFYRLSTPIEDAARGLEAEKGGVEAKELSQRVIGAGERIAGGEQGLEALRRMRDVDGATAGGRSVGGDKGKQKVVISEQPDLTLPLSQIHELFPSLSPTFLRSCLLHPLYSSSGAEGVIAALLEGTLPAELERARDGVDPVVVMEEPKREEKPTEAASTRNNVFAAPLDAGKIRRGKERSTDLLSDRSFMTDSIKASIIARAEHESSDEDETAEGEAFVEDYDAPEAGRFGVRDAGEGEDGEEVISERRKEVDSKTVTPVGSGRSTPLPPPPAFGPAVTHYLETTYIANASLFDRSSEVRRSKERKQLRERTGLGDEQIEGWRIMLERNPKKDKILASHGITTTSSTSSNLITTTALPQANTNHLHEAPAPSSSSRGRGGAGRGGGGGDRGRGGRGRGDGGRRESERRQRGSDRKSALGRLA